MMGTKTKEKSLAELIAESAVESPTRAEFPVDSLLSIDEHGLAFRSKQSFEVGCVIDLGLHLRFRAFLPAKQQKDRASFNRHGYFLDLHGFVVDCRLVQSRGQYHYEVTLLFDEVGKLERRLLRRVPPEDVEARSGDGLSNSERLLFGQKPKGVSGLN